MEGMKYKVSGRGMAGEIGISEVSVLTWFIRQADN